jgi:hypothetical protein
MRDGRGRRQAGRRALERAGTCEAENPGTPPCEDGPSAASASENPVARTSKPSLPPPLSSSAGLQRCRPTSRRLASAPLCRAGREVYRTKYS